MNLSTILAVQPDIEDIVEETQDTAEEFSAAPLVVLGIAAVVVIAYVLVRWIINRSRHDLPEVATSAVVQPAEFQTETALRFEDVKVSFSTEFGTVEAVKGVTFDVKPGEVVAVVGESGSGKSVTSSTAMGLMADNATVSGNVFVDGKEITMLTPSKLRALRGDEISMVFQEPMTALNPVLKVSDQLVEALQVHHKAFGREALAQAIRLLEEVGIPDAQRRIHEYPHQFSGGQRQRIVIAIAIACNPKVIIADEPTTALDVTVQAEILDLLRQLKDELNTGILLITHNVGVVADMADRVVVMFQGEVVESGPVEKILTEPEHAYTKRLLDAVPTLSQPQIEVNESNPADHQHPASPAVDPGAKLFLEAKDLALAYQKKGRSTRVVEDVNFAVARGEILGLVGESGSGKSTVAKAVLGLLEVEQGELLVRGRNLPALPRAQQKALRREIGVVFQDPAASLDPRFPIGEIITEPLVVHQEGNSKERVARAEELLEAVKLPRSIMNRYPHELSGGQRQRISIARAMALSPSILIADEPTSALDVSVQARVLEMFVELQQQYDFACLFVTHDLAVVDQLADQVMVMEKGRVVEQGRKDQILRTPREDYTKRLLAAAPVPNPDEQRLRRHARWELLASQGQR
ncbi:ABC transporter ATP-binding protein [Auritidibacter sp. NML130574]|uniref:ABC transporter ATP-binding protein n=1 Tax=Auritidibacter sp. NML130574 TaxID=2170745 RepID=UPI000D732D6A|nr:ABC transporter ATP-binding protein [Auritidibacter sp. NML130574]AXR74575.1 ABC transporter ATP-binding protein [Auritidibacter sp. NML130574]